MAFGRDLDARDSERIREILHDPDVRMVQFFPMAGGFAEYEELEYFRNDGSAVVLERGTALFAAVFAIVEEHDYPAEFNDKFFVELAAPAATIAGHDKGPESTGYTCKECNGPSPVGIGYPNGKPAATDVDTCPCGHSRKPAGKPIRAVPPILKAGTRHPNTVDTKRIVGPRSTTIHIDDNSSRFGLVSCDVCGDDVDVHTWIRVTLADSTVVDCDRIQSS